MRWGVGGLRTASHWQPSWYIHVSMIDGDGIRIAGMLCIHNRTSVVISYYFEVPMLDGSSIGNNWKYVKVSCLAS